MVSKVIILAGAPSYKDLELEDRKELLQDFTEPISRFAGLNEKQDKKEGCEEIQLPFAVWRLITLEKRRYLHTGFSQYDTDSQTWATGRFQQLGQHEESSKALNVAGGAAFLTTASLVDATSLVSS